MRIALAMANPILMFLPTGATELSVCFLHVPALSPAQSSSQRSCNAPLFVSSTSRARIKSKVQKLKDNHSYITPSQYVSGEVAGISIGLGLLKDFGRRLKIGRRRPLQETLENTFLLKTEGRRRKEIKNRLKRLGYKFTSGEDGHLELKSTEHSPSDWVEDEYKSYSLDGLRATAGVLRTKIRMKQDELKELDVLMRDVVGEMRMEDFLSKNSRESGVDAVRTNTLTNPLGNDEMMGENELVALNDQWKNNLYDANSTTMDHSNNEESDDDALVYEFQLDLMKTRAAEFQSTILLDRIKLQRLDRRISCCESGELGVLERAVGNTLYSLNESEFLDNPFTMINQRGRKFAATLRQSSSVLFRRIDRESMLQEERNLESLSGYVYKETSAGVRIVKKLLSNPSQLTQLIDPDTPTLIPHVPAILSRLDRLESHVAPILSSVLNNKQHLRSIEPYLPEILERFDDIEPHLEWILDNIDVLAPYTGLLLKHIDELLLYAAVDEYETGDGSKDNYAFAKQLLPYLEVYVSKLDVIGPHLPLLRPHLPLLLKHDRIKILSPHVGRLFAKGYQDLSASANMDILLFYFGWALRIPLLPLLFFSFPASPRLVSFLANRLPKRLVRGRCYNVSCFVDGDYGGEWNKLSE